MFSHKPHKEIGTVVRTGFTCSRDVDTNFQFMTEILMIFLMSSVLQVRETKKFKVADSVIM